MKRLWYPTEEDVALARAAIFALPLMLLIFVIELLLPRAPALGITVVVFAAFVLVRGVVLVRAALSLPLVDYDIERYKAMSHRARRTCRTVGLILPLASSLALPFKPEIFLIAFGTLTFVSVMLLGQSATAPPVFTIAVAGYPAILFALAVIQYGLAEALWSLVIAGIVIPQVLSLLIKTRRATESVHKMEHSF